MTTAPEQPGDHGIGDARQAERLRAYVGEVLRWNSGTNLISRVHPADRLAALLDHSVAGFLALEGALGEALTSCGIASRTFVYADIGSGAGLPGLPWRILMDDWGAPPRATWLVEPRARRAWFLARAARSVALADCFVHEGRWGEGPPLAPLPEGPVVWILSLMMLRRTDPEVLEGWRKAASGASVRAAGLIIARPRGPLGSGVSTEILATDLHLPEPACRRIIPFRGHATTGSLVLSVYGPAVGGP